MKIAIAGTSQVSTYLVSALTTSGHDVVVLTRSDPKTALPVPHRITDYTVPSLISALSDRDALISTVISYTDPTINTSIHLAMLSACIQSTRCKTFLPSEWTSNALDHPDQPMFMRSHTQALHPALCAAKREHAINYTIICNSWFMDYIVPSPNRLLRDLGPIWPMDHASKTFTVYGDGNANVSLVTVRDVANAVARLLQLMDTGEAQLEEFTFVEGQLVSWNELYEIVNRKSGGGWRRVAKPLSETVDGLVKAEKEGDGMGVLLGQFEVLAWSGASVLPREKVVEQRERLFGGLRFRTVEEVLDLVEGDRTVVV